MQCPECQFENPEGTKFCGECGAKLERLCPSCNSSSPPNFKFCGECGHRLLPADDIFKQKSDSENLPTPSSRKESPSDIAPAAGERKHVTVLFSDLIGYTAMSERLDPEEVKGITTRIFDEVSKIISKYEGFIEKFAGDAVMALFGATTAHEDDPVRAINAAKEIHTIVTSLSTQYEESIEQPLSMHTGINTGLVVTGDVNLEKGIHGVAGDTINVASRLCSLGSSDDILVSPDTYYQAQGFYNFKELEPALFKGKSEPIRVYKVLSVKERPVKVHRLDGLKAELIGRKVEMNQLTDAAHKLKEGHAVVFTICGAAGTGKSRLIYEFKESLNLDQVQWLEGQAFPFSQNMSYFPLIDLLTKAFQIKEGDGTDVIKDKIETAISSLIDEKHDVMPYIGTLFSLNYPEVDDVSPEFWKAQLQTAVRTLLSALARRTPLVVCLEDLHWSDPSFLELIRILLTNFQEPVFFLCSYRPTISLFSSHQIESMTNHYREIRLQDLSPTESQTMVESLLKTDTIPPYLLQFVQDKVEGNPFYLEEVINSLIETGALVRGETDWKVTRPITEADISSTIHGVISGRLDRLEKETKRILQEASVIGRSFFYEILSRITELEGYIDRSIHGLERLDLIRTRSLQPDLEYIFKHALTQEVVYNGLLKKERRSIHERIGLVMEQLFKDRLPEFYETLAYHFARGESMLKAVNYLIKAGGKSLRRYALEEAHKYFKEAYEVLDNKPGKTAEELKILVDLIISWALVYYYRGDANGLKFLLENHLADARQLQNKATLGMYYAWFGFSTWSQGFRLGDAYKHLVSAIQLGEESGDQQVVGYALAWLSWVCGEMGLFDEAISYGQRAREIAKDYPSDQFMNFKPVAGLGWTYWLKGDAEKAFECGKIILEYGQKHSNIRSMTLGYYFIACSHLISGDIPTAAESFKKAIRVGKDPFYVTGAKVLLGTCYIYAGQYDDAETLLREGADFYHEFGLGLTGVAAELCLGAVLISKGKMTEGLKIINDSKTLLWENSRKCFYVIAEIILGNLYLQVVLGEGPKSISMIAKNIGFLIKNVPSAARKAEFHLNRAIEIEKEIGAQGNLGIAYLGLGRLYKAKKKYDQASQSISKAIQIFEKCGAEVYLKQANETLKSLG